MQGRRFPNSLTNTGSATNYGSIGGGVTNSGTFTNETGATVNGGMLNNSGVVAGAVINSGTFYNNPGATVNGGLTNTGTVYALGTLTGAISTPNTFDTFVVSSGPVTVSATTGVVSPMLGQTLYIGSPSPAVHSSFTGNITIPVNLSNGLSNTVYFQNTTISNASYSLTGNLSNPSNTIYNQAITLSNAQLTASPQAEQVLAGLSSNGPFTYTPVSTPTETEIVQSLNINHGPGPTLAPGIVATIENTLNTSFFQDLDPYFTTTPDTNSNTSPQYTAQTGFQNTAPLISSSANPAPNTWHGGVWSRGGYADNTIDSTISGGGNLASTNSSVQTQLSGFQVGSTGAYTISRTRV